MKDKIASLMKEKGYNRTVASAIAYKMQQGGTQPQNWQSDNAPFFMQRQNPFQGQNTQFPDFKRQPTDVNNLSGQQAYRPGDFTGVSIFEVSTAFGL